MDNPVSSKGCSFVDLLAQLGLTGQKARVFKAVVQYPGSTATEIVECSKVPSNKVYQHLSDLEGAGLLFPSGIRPRLYWPEDLSHVLAEKKIVLEKEVEALVSLRSEIGRIISDLQKKATGSDLRLPGGHVAVVRVKAGSEAEIFRDLCEVLESTKEKLLFLGDFEDFLAGIKHGVSDAVEALYRRGINKLVQVIGLVPEVLEDARVVEYFSKRERSVEGRDFRYFLGRQKFGIGAVVVDDRLVGLLLKNPVLSEFKLAFYVDSRGLASELTKLARALDPILERSFPACLERASEWGIQAEL
ncbi:MAG: TrmB family transcriptional regulator [Promethearchaeota archaeon]